MRGMRVPATVMDHGAAMAKGNRHDATSVGAWPARGSADVGHRARRHSGENERKNEVDVSRKFRCQSMGPDPMRRYSVVMMDTISNEAYVRSSWTITHVVTSATVRSNGNARGKRSTRVQGCAGKCAHGALLH